MRLILVILTALLVTSCGSKIEYQGNSEISKVRKSTGFVFGTNDIPVLSGLEFIEEESTNFDTIAGHIAISSYYTDLKVAEVKDFYMITLPQIGFKINSHKEKNIAYKRGKEKLEVSFENKEDELTVKFLTSSN